METKQGIQGSQKWLSEVVSVAGQPLMLYCLLGDVTTGVVLESKAQIWFDSSNFHSLSYVKQVTSSTSFTACALSFLSAKQENAFITANRELYNEHLKLSLMCLFLFLLIDEVCDKVPKVGPSSFVFAQYLHVSNKIISFSYLQMMF